VTNNGLNAAECDARLGAGKESVSAAVHGGGGVLYLDLGSGVGRAALTLPNRHMTPRLNLLKI
jgi:hypothetical protein